MKLRATGLAFMLGAAAFTKTTALLALPAFVFGAVRITDPRARRGALAATILTPTLVTAAWVAFQMAHGEGVVPGAVAPDPSKLQNGFVRAMAGKNPASFFYVPFLLDCGYLFLVATLLRRGRDPRLVHLRLYPLCILSGYTALALAGVGTYHNKYVSIAMPGLAVLAGLAFCDRIDQANPWRWARYVLLVPCLGLLIHGWLVFGPLLSERAEVFPRDVLRPMLKR